MIKYQEAQAQIQIAIPKLQELCYRCRGSKEVYLRNCNTSEKCVKCKGVGYIPTSYGETLLNFINMHSNN